MSYGIIFWAIPNYSKIIFKIQKRVIRIITNSGNRDSCRDLFKNLNILPLQSQYLLTLLMFVVKNKELFKSNLDVLYIILTQDPIMIYIYLRQIWQYFRRECGILASKLIIIFQPILNNYQIINLNSKWLQKDFSHKFFLHIGVI
jgi:hypothetical protein